MENNLSTGFSSNASAGALNPKRLWLEASVLVIALAAAVFLALPFAFALHRELQAAEVDLERARNAALALSALLATLLGGALAALRTIALMKQASSAQMQAGIATKQADIAEQGHITDRIGKAVEQLGHDKMTVRLGGAYALERIAKDSERDHWSIMEILCSFVRRRSHPTTLQPYVEGNEETRRKEAEKKEDVETDVQAVLTILSRRQHWNDPADARLNLADAHLRGLRLEGGDLRRADLRNANLSDARLRDMALDGAMFNRSVLSNAKLHGTSFRRAMFVKTDLFRSRCFNARFEEATFYKSRLAEGKWGNSSFEGADIAHSDFDRADLGGAILDRGSARNASFRDVTFEGPKPRPSRDLAALEGEAASD